MAPIQRAERSVYAPTDFIEWRAADGLALTPKFQRRGVWGNAARSYFIDTLLRGMPVPPIYIRLGQSAARNRVVREVIDGQQRIAAVLDFVDGKYPLSRSLSESWAGKDFAGLSESQKRQVTQYSFSCEIFKGIADLEVLEIFERLNTYSVPLNAQELRNGKFFGQFKQCVYGLAREHLEFWRRHSLFSERSIARMLEVEFVSEIVAAFLGGMQDKKKSLNGFYAEFDEEFERRERKERQFREVADMVNAAFDDDLDSTEFSRSPLAYTLFCVLYHRRYGMKNATVSTPKKDPTTKELALLNGAVHRLSAIIVAGRENEIVPDSYVDFVGACLRQTDNIKPRAVRFKALYSMAFR